MEKADRAVYTPLDFSQWRATNALSLTPKFQRRGVWKSAARSFFIDTLLRGMPIPPVYMRQSQSPERDRTIREVIDGQQRISAVLAFKEGDYRLSKALKAPWAGKSFDALSVAEQDQINNYGFSAEVFKGISDMDVLEMFSRLNTYSVGLNAQELRNGRYFGKFKQTVYVLSYEHLELWRRQGLFSERAIARMQEAEFVSEILIAFLHGMQDKKKSIDTFYEQYDDEFQAEEKVAKRFREVIDCVNDTFPDTLKGATFSRVPLAYTLFCVIYHRLHGLPQVDAVTPRKALTRDERNGLREAVERLSEKIEAARANEEVTQKYAAFVAACLRQTDNIKPRLQRFVTLYRVGFE